MSDSPSPVRCDLKLVYAGSLAVAVLMIAVSVAGILYWRDLYPASQAASSAGSDAFNLVAILPVLLLSMWLARRGRLIGLLLWPGALFYVLYIYAFYVIGLPVTVLFLPYVALVVLSAYALIGLVAGIDGDAVRQRLASHVPHRAAGGVLIGLAVLFIAMDAYAVVDMLAGNKPIDIQTSTPWIVDLIVECPALLLGGILLWRRAARGYAAGAGLLFQIAALLIGVPVSFALGAFLTGSPMDTDTITLLFVGVVPLGLLAFFMRGRGSGNMSMIPGHDTHAR
ncbi:MAG: hypothetical protein A4E28_00488 [Methanocella sp. PtaU1.Bin125]|nr:MAG: hypothetical protein A4E28_00488 [Methanocella sp. PtaU1.Bin125]